MTKTAEFLSWVKLTRRYLDEDNPVTLTRRIAKAGDRIIEPDSPIGMAMLGKEAGWKGTVEVPGGTVEVELLKVW